MRWASEVKACGRTTISRDLSPKEKLRHRVSKVSVPVNGRHPTYETADVEKVLRETSEKTTPCFEEKKPVYALQDIYRVRYGSQSLLWRVPDDVETELDVSRNISILAREEIKKSLAGVSEDAQHGD